MWCPENHHEQLPLYSLQQVPRAATPLGSAGRQSPRLQPTSQASPDVQAPPHSPDARGLCRPALPSGVAARGLIEKNVRVVGHGGFPDTTFISSGGDHKQAENWSPAQILPMKRRCPGRALGPPSEFCFEVADAITAGNPNRPTPDHLVHDLEPHDDCVAGCLRGPVLGWGSPVGDCLEWVAWLAGRATVSATSGAWASNGGYGFGSFRRWPRWVVSNRGSVS